MTVAITSREWHLIARPHRSPRPEDLALREARIPPLAQGQVLARNLYLSVDPYMRRRMDDVESYVPPFRLGEPMEGGAVGVAVASAVDGIAVGDHVQHMLGWREHAVLRPPDVTRVDPARLQGMLARDHADLRPQFLAQASEWIRGGKLTYRETIAEGIESAARAFMDMLSGANTGKMLVRLNA